MATTYSIPSTPPAYALQMLQMQNALAAQMAQLTSYQQALGGYVATTTASTTTNAIGTYVPMQQYAGTGQLGTPGPNPYAIQTMAPRQLLGRDVRLDDGTARTVHLPDGTLIEVAADGSFEIHDENATVIYRANRVRAFNAFLNASDKIEAFIGFCGEHGVRQDEMLDLPLRLFIGWLVIEAAKADNEPEPPVALIPDLRKVAAPRCHSCRRFISFAAKRAHVEFCGPRCFERHYARLEAA